MKRNETKEIQKIRIIEWEDLPPAKTKGRKKKATFSPETHQILEWLIREVLLLEFGFGIGFQADMPRIKRSKFPSAHEYVEAIIEAIEVEQRKRTKRFKAAIKFYDYMKRDLDPEPYEIERYRREIGADEDGSVYGAKLTIHRPEKVLSYGFEKLFLSKMPDLMRLSRALSELGFANQKEFTASQIETVRKELKRPGWYLSHTPGVGWTFDFTNVPLVKHLTFCSIALYRNLENPPGQINEFVYKKISYFFRGLGDLNETLRQEYSSSLIRQRVKGDENGKFMARCEQAFLDLDLISDDLYECLEQLNGISRSGVTQYQF